MKKANKKTLYLSGLISENEYLEYQQKEHTFVAVYRITDPALTNQISSMDGTEVEFDDKGAVVSIDTMTHPQTAEALLKMAGEKKLIPIGIGKRDKARSMGTNYIPTRTESVNIENLQVSTEEKESVKAAIKLLHIEGYYEISANLNSLLERLT